MNLKVALLRGINVGGKNSLPMQDLRDILATLGCENMTTYIQSGNVVFSSDAGCKQVSTDITEAIQSRFGFAPSVLVMTGRRFTSIAAANPFVDDVLEPKFLHIWFLAEPPKNADVARMREECAASELFHLSAQALYLLAPNGIGRSKFANNAERYVGVPATARNWRTVSKLVELIEQAS